MGQLVGWPEVLTEGADLDECRAMLRDALREMVLAYRDLGKEIPSHYPSDFHPDLTPARAGRTRA